MTPVGHPTHERLITMAVLRQALEIYPVTRGHALLALHEPDLQQGRPDIVLVCVRLAQLEVYLEARLRLPTTTAARVLAQADEGDATGVELKYARRISRDLASAGWDRAHTQKALSVITWTVGIEAKMSDWRRAMRQIAAWRGTVDRAALAMPAATVGRVDPKQLEFYRSGLLVSGPSGVVEARPSESVPVSAANRLWMLESLVRGIEADRCYRLSSSLNFSRLSRRIPTLVL